MTATNQSDETAEVKWSVPESGCGSVDPPLDQMFDALKNTRRRYTLYYLAEHGSASLSELGEQLTAWEEQREADAPKRERVYTSLYHTHLPRLDAIGLVEYDRDRGIVRKASNTAQTDDYLQFTEQYEFDSA